MEVSFMGGLIGNSGLLQKESLNGSTSQMVTPRMGGNSRDFNKTSSQNPIGDVLL